MAGGSAARVLPPQAAYKADRRDPGFLGNQGFVDPPVSERGTRLNRHIALSHRRQSYASAPDLNSSAQLCFCFVGRG
jgi:hypothetical protein